MSTQKPDLTRVWANGAPPANVVDPDTTTPGKVNAGWQAEVPPFEHFNFLQKWFTQGLAHFNEQGIGVWDTDTTYPQFGMAKGTDGAIYVAVQEQSGNDPVSDDGTNWLDYLTSLNDLFEADPEKGLALVSGVEAAVYNGSTLFTPPAQPDANGDPGSIADHNNWDPDDYITNLWEVLRAEFPNNISRILQGKDESGVYDIWRYTFEPENPTKTILITCNVHGFERISQTGTYLFLRHIYKDWKTYPQLAHLRKNVRFVVIPIMNPWGLAQTPTSRYNSNGVDLNRNWDYRWDDWDDTVDSQPKGSAAFSEVETQYAKALLDDYPEAVCYFDMHDLNGPGDAQWTAYGPWPMLNGTFQNIANEVFESIKAPADDALIFYTQAPTAFNYAADTYGMISANPEANTDGTSSSRWTSGAMTRAVNFWGNLFIKAANKETPKRLTNEPFIRHATWTAGGGDSNPVINTGTYTEIPGFTISERIRGSGYLKFSGVVIGNVSGTLTGEKTRVFVCPAIGHAQNPLVVFSEARTELWESFLDGEQNDRTKIEFEAVLPVSGDFVPVDIVNLFKAGIRMKVNDVTGTGGSFEVTRYFANLEFIPSNNPERFTWLRATGDLSEGFGAMKPVDIY